MKAAPQSVSFALSRLNLRFAVPLLPSAGSGEDPTDLKMPAPRPPPQVNSDVAARVRGSLSLWVKVPLRLLPESGLSALR